MKKIENKMCFVEEITRTKHKNNKPTNEEIYWLEARLHINCKPTSEENTFSATQKGSSINIS